MRVLLAPGLDVGAQVPPLEHRDAAAHVAHADREVDVPLRLLHDRAAALGSDPVTLGEHDLLGRIVEARVHEDGMALLGEGDLRDARRAVGRAHGPVGRARQHERAARGRQRGDRDPVGHGAARVAGPRAAGGERQRRHRGARAPSVCRNPQLLWSSAHAPARTHPRCPPFAAARSGPGAEPQCLGQDQVHVAELVPEVAALDGGAVGAREELGARRRPRACAGARTRARASP